MRLDRAIDRFLGANPEYRENFIFVQIGVPSRSRIRSYKMLEDEIGDMAEDINSKWGTESWKPIVLIKEMVPHSRLIALHSLRNGAIDAKNAHPAGCDSDYGRPAPEPPRRREKTLTRGNAKKKARRAYSDSCLKTFTRARKVATRPCNANRPPTRTTSSPALP